MNSNQQKLWTIVMLAAAITTSSACGNANQEEVQTTRSATQEDMQSPSGYTDKSPAVDADENTWVPLEPAIASLGYRMKDETGNGGYAKIGFSDVMYMLRPDSKQVFSLGQKFDLPEAPKRRDGHIYLTTASLSKLLQTNVHTNANNGEIVIDTPEDTEEETEPSNSIRIQSTSVNKNELVSYAKRFMGVPYEFGADAYEKNKTFDCSSYTRHIFKRFGVTLPRLAKDQDNKGRRVKRSELAPGDLVFFTVPGRFKSNAVPGHVGIYIGNGKFIHTWGDPGVQISNLDTGYWSNVRLHMQRVL